MKFYFYIFFIYSINFFLFCYVFNYVNIYLIQILYKIILK